MRLKSGALHSDRRLQKGEPVTDRAGPFCSFGAAHHFYDVMLDCLAPHFQVQSLPNYRSALLGPVTAFLSRPVYHLVSGTTRCGCPSSRESSSSLKLQSSVCTLRPVKRPRDLNVHISRGPNLPLLRLKPTLEMVSLSCDGMFIMASEWLRAHVFVLRGHLLPLMSPEFSNIITTAHISTLIYVLV